jgi:hypothetical protein
MALTLLFTLLLFSIVQTKIIHYSSLCYFPITFLAASYVFDKLESKSSLKTSARSVLFGLILFGFIFIFTGWVLNHPELILNNFKTDAFTRDSLNQNSTPSLLYYIPGVYLLASAILLHYNYRKEQSKLLLAGVSLTMAIGIITLVPMVKRIEMYSQGGHVALCKSVRREHKNALIHPVGFKSFVPLFYGLQNGTIMKNDKEAMDEFNLVNKKKLNRTVFFTSKAYKKMEILALYPNLIFVDEKGGFCLYQKKEQVLIK